MPPGPDAWVLRNSLKSKATRSLWLKEVYQSEAEESEAARSKRKSKAPGGSLRMTCYLKKQRCFQAAMKNGERKEKGVL